MKLIPMPGPIAGAADPGDNSPEGPSGAVGGAEAALQRMKERRETVRAAFIDGVRPASKDSAIYAKQEHVPRIMP